MTYQQFTKGTVLRSFGKWGNKEILATLAPSAQEVWIKPEINQKNCFDIGLIFRRVTTLHPVCALSPLFNGIFYYLHFKRKLLYRSMELLCPILQTMLIE